MKAIGLLFWLGVFIYSSHTGVARAADGEESDWLRANNTECKVWDSPVPKGFEITWRGSCPSGVANGYGEVDWYRRGELYETWVGYFKGGHPTRLKISYLKSDGAISYEGDFPDAATGFGRFVYKDGSTYTGQLIDGKANGSGEFRLSNGWSYTGAFKDGKMSGWGEIRYVNAYYYIGDVVDGKRSGYGLFRGSVTYEGQWIADKPNGNGILIGPTGIVTYGGWSGWLPNGDSSTLFPPDYKGLSAFFVDGKATEETFLPAGSVAVPSINDLPQVNVERSFNPVTPP